MPAYIVKNGTLQLRQKDPSSTYRIIPYKSSLVHHHIVSYNDYVNNSISELQGQLSRVRQDYYRLVSALWRVLSDVDSTPYDQHVMFFNLPTEEICNQISLIRNLNLPEQEDSSLRLSAIIKVDENSISSPRQPFLINTQHTTTMSTPDYYQIQPPHSPQRSMIRDCRRDSSLYRIMEEQGEEENVCNLSRIDDKQQEKQQFATLPMIQRRNSSLGVQVNQQQQPQYQSSPPHHHHLNMSSQKQPKQPRRTSFLLKQKISIALHQQQQLRQLLEQQLQKMTQQLDQKNQYLSWTVEELNIRNELIDKLKEAIVIRDQALQQMESGQLCTISNQEIQTKKTQQILQQQDKEIGLLINSLIQRTDSTFEDLQYLIAKSVQPFNQQNQPQQQLQIANYQQNSSNQADRTIDIGDLQRSVQRSYEEERSQSLNKVAMSPPPYEQEQNESRVSLLSNSPGNNKQQNMQVSYQALQPKKMNFSPSPTRQPIKYLTKQHFLQAEKKTANRYILQNVKMTESVKMDTSSTSLINTFTYL